MHSFDFLFYFFKWWFVQCLTLLLFLTNVFSGMWVAFNEDIIGLCKNCCNLFVLGKSSYVIIWSLKTIVDKDYGFCCFYFLLGGRLVRLRIEIGIGIGMGMIGSYISWKLEWNINKSFYDCFFVLIEIMIKKVNRRIMK